MGTINEYGVDVQHVQDFWQGVHEHVCAFLEEMKAHPQPVQVSMLEGRTYEWLLELHALAHQVDEESEAFVLPQCDHNRYTVLMHDPVRDELWMNK